MKYQAPEGCTGISVGGEQFNVDKTGHIEVPDNGDYHALLAPHGFMPAAEPTVEAKAPKAASKQAKVAAEPTVEAKAPKAAE